jgi:hypothetical protein
VVNENYRYIQWIHVPTGKIEAEELYDHSIDSGENINISEYPEYYQIKNEMKMLLKSKWKMDPSILSREKK